jgi:hypothetical protein
MGAGAEGVVGLESKAGESVEWVVRATELA